MIYFKACPRCRGDMYLTGDYYGEYRECLQCGYSVDVQGTRMSTVGSQRPVEHVESRAA